MGSYIICVSIHCRLFTRCSSLHRVVQIHAKQTVVWNSDLFLLLCVVVHCEKRDCCLRRPMHWLGSGGTCACENQLITKGYCMDSPRTSHCVTHNSLHLNTALQHESTGIVAEVSTIVAIVGHLRRPLV